MTWEQLTATYRVVTPMFCGGSDGTRAEFRLPSFKGVLRWWWRALAWSRLGGDLERIRAAEADLFGSAGGGQSRVVMKLLEQRDVAVANGGELSQRGPGCRYLAYGAMGSFGKEDKKPPRGCLTTGELTIALRLREPDANERELLGDALRAIGLFGGMGAKSRKGYGSLMLTKLDGVGPWAAPNSVDALSDALGKIAYPPGVPASDALPSYTAFSANARVVVVRAEARSDAMALLDRVGRELMRYRSWGQGGQIFGRESEKNFKKDHNLMKQRPHERRQHPLRVVFGLPHNYGKEPGDQVKPVGWERRASPLLFHIHLCDATPVVVAAFLPSVFLPDKPMIDVGTKPMPLAEPPEFWRPVHRFLDRLLGKVPGERKERFGEALEVRP